MVILPGRSCVDILLCAETDEKTRVRQTPQHRRTYSLAIHGEVSCCWWAGGGGGGGGGIV